MSFKKIGENLNFTQADIKSPEVALGSEEIAERFVKMARNLKKVAPKASDFLYFSSIMMHAAEASLIDQKTGEPLLNKSGKPVTGAFEKFTNEKGQDSIKWVSADGIKAYKNANGDLFPEEQLLVAHKKWIGKPLCRDHVSDSVDGIRGIIVDTYYDPKYKRVFALSAIDKKNYADLARKVETGYSNSVSMGTAVGRSVCYDCGNVAQTEKEFCSHVRSRSCYGEINLDLNPIELSLVVNGADGLAKIKQVIASMNNYVEQKTNRVEEMKNTACINPTEVQALSDEISDMQKRINAMMASYSGEHQVKSAADEAQSPIDISLDKTIIGLTNAIERAKNDPSFDPESLNHLEGRLKALQTGSNEPSEENKPEEVTVQPVQSTTGGGFQGSDPELKGPPSWAFNPENRLASKKNDGGISGAQQDFNLLRTKLADLNNNINLFKNISKEENMNSARLKARAKARYAYWQGGGGVNEPTPGKTKYPEMGDYQKIRDTEDKQMVGSKEDLEAGTDGLAPGDLEIKKKLNRASDESATLNKLSSEQLSDRRNQRRAYFQGGGGVNEPTPGKTKYPEMGDYQKIRDTEDKQMVGKPEDMDAGTDGLAAGDLEIKKKLLRASLSARFMKATNKDGSLNKNASRWDVYAGNDLVLSATASEIFEDEVDQKWDYLSSADYGRDVIQSIRQDGFEHVAYLLKGADVDADKAKELANGLNGQSKDSWHPLDDAAKAVKKVFNADDAKEEDEMEMNADAPVAAPAAGVAGQPTAPVAAVPAPQAAPNVAKPVAPMAAKADDVSGDLKSKVEEFLNIAEDKIEELRTMMGDNKDQELADVSVDGNEAAAPAPMDLAKADDMMKTEALLDQSADELALIGEKLETSASSNPQLIKAAKQALADFQVVVAEANVVIAAAKKDKKEKARAKAPKAWVEMMEKKMKKQDPECSKKEMNAAIADTWAELSDKQVEKLLAKHSDKKAKAADLRSLLLKAAMEDEDMEDGEVSDPAEEKAEVKHFEAMREEDDAIEEAAAALSKHLDALEEMPSHTPFEADTMHAKMEEDCDMASDMVVKEDAAQHKAARIKARNDLVARAADSLGKEYTMTLDSQKTVTEPTFFQAHPKGGTMTELTTKTQGGKVETGAEQHDAILEVAEKQPTKVREAAKLLQTLVASGSLKASDLDRLVAEGKVDAETVKYFKDFWAQAGDKDSSAFGAELTKEFTTKKAAASTEQFKIKLRRAYDIALEAQSKGMIDENREALDKYVDSLVGMDDAGFESMKRAVSNTRNLKKSAGMLPNVGVNQAANFSPTVNNSSVAPEQDIADLLKSLNWSSNGRK